MRRILVSLLALSFLLVVADRLVGGAMETLFRRSPSIAEGDQLGRAAAFRAPIVVCGSSRAMHHYVADSLSADLGVPVFNLGRDGAEGTLYPYAVAGTLLRRYVPRLFILDVSAITVSGAEKLDRLACLLPYVDQSPAAAEVVALRSRYEKLRLLSRTYRYNSLVLSLLSPMLGKREPQRQGYLPVSGTMKPAAATDAAPVAIGGAAVPLDSLKLRYLRKTIALLRARGVTPLAVQSPAWIAGAADRDRALRQGEELRRLFAGLGVRYLRISPLEVPSLGESRLYADPTHLNDEGARRFSHVLADSLRSLESAPLRPSAPPAAGPANRR
jgi:hypothetical protein